ncbi:MAG: YdcF family protein [Sediminispirochaetaceae bacterium]
MIYTTGKVLSYIFLPPGVFILLFLVLLVLSYRTKRTTTRVILALMVLFLYALSIEPVSRLLLNPLERVYPFRTADSFSREEADAIVVLGAGTSMTPPQSGPAEEEVPDTLPVPQPSDETLSRLVHGYLIHRSTGLPIAVSGGSARGDRAIGADTNGVNGASEAEVMKAVLLELGVRSDLILTETQSRTTAENAFNLAAMAKFGRIILVTSAYHLPRSVWLFEKSGIQPVPAPANYKNGGRELSVWSFFPSMQTLSNSYRALHEYAGIVFNLLQFVNNEKKG